LIAVFFVSSLGNIAFVRYVKLISLLVPMTALYFAYTGCLNGMKLFLLEALSVMIYPILRLLSVPMGYLSSDKPGGIVVGFILASFLSV
jgi:hypothetical protein